MNIKNTIFAPIVMGVAVVWASPGWSLCAVDLPKAIENFLPEPFAQVGIVISPESTPSQPIVAINQEKSFIPASTMKLFTTAAALTFLGDDFRVTTLFQVLPSGTLVVRGGGDPSFSASTHLPQVAKQLREKGILELQNIQIIPDRWGPLYGMGWEWQDLQEYYAAPINAASVDQNVVLWQIVPGSSIGHATQFRWEHPDRAMGWRVTNLSTTTQAGTVDRLEISKVGERHLKITGTLPMDSASIAGATPVSSPDVFFRELLQQAFQAQKKEPIPSPAQPSLPLAITISSPPLAELVAYTNKNSDNFYAEQVLRILGKARPQIQLDYEASGKAIVKAFVNTSGFSIEDGSGLSRHNLVTPHQVVVLLSKMRNHQKFRQSLAIAGKDGTLAQRLVGVELQGKTGTARGIAALSGYLSPPQYSPLVFSILINHSQHSSTHLRDRIDRILQLVNQLQHC